MSNKRVLVFGTFDGLHPGHLFFLRQAKTRGDILIVGVARDRHVRDLKDKHASNLERARKEAVEALRFVDEAHLCDEELGTFELVRTVQPDVIVLGYDQRELEESLIAWMQVNEVYIPITRIKKQ